MYSVLMISQSIHDIQEGNKTHGLVILRVKNRLGFMRKCLFFLKIFIFSPDDKINKYLC